MQQLASRDENDISPTVSLQQRVYEKLRNNLISGVYAPGEFLSLRRLAAANGVSPMPVREAVKRLISEGAIELLPNRTIIVPKLRRRHFVELIRVREMLEGEAAELAAASMSSAIILKLAQANVQLLQADADGDIAATMRANQDFHFGLYRTANSPVILPLIEALWVRMGPIFHTAKQHNEVTWNASQHHAALLALEQRNAAAVRRAIEEDIRNAGQELLALDIFAPE